MRVGILLFVLGLITAARVQAEPSDFPLELRSDKAQALFKTLEVVEAVTENDPLYGGTVKYTGYSLESVLTVLRDLHGLDSRHGTITFQARDGYRIIRDLSTFPNVGGVLAFKASNAPPGAAFLPVPEGKESVDPAPYALVWDRSVPNAIHGLPWPHAIEEIDLTDTTTIPKVLLSPRKGHEKGRIAFANACLQCHSMNRYGGQIGPELNVPKNVTEYWSMETLRALLANPNEFRWRSRMPAFSHLSEGEREEILQYIASMKDAKVCASAAQCDSLPLEERAKD